MPMHHFTLVLDREPTGEEIDALFEAGCDDASFRYGPGESIGDFDREAPTLADAIASALRNVESVGFLVLRVVDDDTDPALVVANLILQARQHRDRVAHLSALTDLLVA
jgi:hypothetical protein